MDATVEVLVGPIKVLFQPGDMGVDAFFDRFRRRRQVIFLGDDHLDELASTCGQGSEFQGELVGQGRGSGRSTSA